MAAPAISNAARLGGRVHRIRYIQSGANNGNVDFEATRPLASMTMQLRGTYVAGSVTLQGSNDGSTYVALPTATALSALGVKSVAPADLGFLHYRAVFADMDAGNDLVLDIVKKEL